MIKYSTIDRVLSIVVKSSLLLLLLAAGTDAVTAAAAVVALLDRPWVSKQSESRANPIIVLSEYLCMLNRSAETSDTVASETSCTRGSRMFLLRRHHMQCNNQLHMKVDQIRKYRRWLHITFLNGFHYNGFNDGIMAYKLLIKGFWMEFKRKYSINYQRICSDHIDHFRYYPSLNTHIPPNAVRSFSIYARYRLKIVYCI